MNPSFLSRSQSTKKRQEIAEEEANVADYRKRYPRCQLCRKRKGEGIHEMFGQGRRHVARMHRSCILHLCNLCHDDVQHWSKPRQLLLKMQADSSGFDLAQFNELSPGHPISMKDIDSFRPQFT